MNFLGEFEWTPAYNQAGSYILKFCATDRDPNAKGGYAMDFEEVSITVENQNRPPALNPIGNRTIYENQALAFVVSAADPDADSLTYSVSGLPEGAVFNPATRTFNWKPTYSQSGIYTLTFTVSDGSFTDSKTMTITVLNVASAGGCG